ncbi:hypothetical protein D3C71_2162340 [compost metagenome]
MLRSCNAAVPDTTNLLPVAAQIAMAAQKAQPVQALAQAQEPGGLRMSRRVAMP